MFGTTGGKLFSLDAKTGQPNEAFGEKGVVDLNTPEILQGLPGSDGLSSPPIMYRHLVITGGRTQENPPRGPAGDVRAWDIHTGKLAWTFRSVPRAGEKFNDTWGGDSWKQRSGVNVWGFLSVDVQRGIVYMPFGAPSVDQYGGDRPGDNLFGTSIVAADANTGKYLWHFQVVHHDIWDADLTGAPALIDVKHDGKTIPAVAVINKVGLLFLFDRVTGKPIYGVEERPVPQSEVPLERTSKTQPFPLKPAPLSRMTMTMADLATVTPELEAACRKLVEGCKSAGPTFRSGTSGCGSSSPAIMAGSTGAARRSIHSSVTCSSTRTSSGSSRGSRIVIPTRLVRRRPRVRGTASIRTVPIRGSLAGGVSVSGRAGRNSCRASSRRGDS